MATDRHGDRPVARAHSRRDISGRAYRAVGAAGIQTQLQRPEVYPQRYPRQSGVGGRRATFSPVANESPEILLVEADHDMRNPADFLILNKLAKAVFAVPGISRVQAITRPEGTPIEHTSIPFLLSMQGAGQLAILPFQKERMNDMLKQADEMATTINLMQRMYDSMQQLVNTTHHMVGQTHEMEAITDELRDHIADFDDFWRPVRNYFYWEPHCYDIPICWSLRSIFDAMDGVDEISDKFHDVVNNLDQMT